MKAFLKDIIQAAGQISLDWRSKLPSMRVDRKSAKDFVCEADYAVENYLIGRIRESYPNHSILGEESGQTANDSDYRWIIDPIDGTVSFVHGLPMYSISIALEHKGQLILSAILAPVMKELFMAELGKGATLNDQPIQVSGCDVLADSLIGTGFACVRQGMQLGNLDYFAKVFPHIFEIRRFGSAALHLCYVANGTLDGFWEFGLALHDIAAGKLIVEQAGGKMTDLNGTQTGLPAHLAATNGKIHKPFIDLLASITVEIKNQAKSGHK